MPAIQDALMPGTVLAGRYRIERTVGQGSMGIVTEATDLTLQMRVAVKVMSPERAHNEEARQRFIREARAASVLSNAHVTKLYEVLELENGVPFLVMEFLEGSSLEAIVTRDGPPPLDVVLDWSLQALEGLAEAHRAGFVHRDIKPENLFLHDPKSGPPIVKVVDFGAVKEIASKATRLTKTGSTMGSPAYMPPEQVRAEDDIDQRADVWAMGVSIYEMTTGRLPFGGDSIPQTLAAILREDPVPLRQRRGECSPELEALVNRALSKDRHARFANCAEMLEALRAVRAQLKQTSPVTKTLFFSPSNNPAAQFGQGFLDSGPLPPSTPRPMPSSSIPDEFAETTAARRAVVQQATAPENDPSRVRPRVVINARGHVITTSNTNQPAPKSTPAWLPFVIAGAGGLLVAVIVLLALTWRSSSPHPRPAPATSSSARP
ncbi:MAG: serine/threonine protein kinase [Labilithrix sp.]|nr:serine/threonine protein kinase [Labilithrix sp.]MCW5814495.1 serine/threonine protein kinase [Labilithrix sp.]